MSRITDVEQLENALSADFAWRKKEIADFALALAEQKSEGRKLTLMRGSFTLLYAHWEGYVKQALFSYLDFIRWTVDEASSLHPQILAYCAKSHIAAFVDQGYNNGVHVKLVELLRAPSMANLKFPKSHMDIATHDNLSSKRFRVLDSLLGISVIPAEYESLDSIDGNLLMVRNAVAHGESASILLDEWDAARDYVLKVLMVFSDRVLEAALDGTYLVSEVDK